MDLRTQVHRNIPKSNTFLRLQKDFFRWSKTFIPITVGLGKSPPPTKKSPTPTGKSPTLTVKSPTNKKSSSNQKKSSSNEKKSSSNEKSPTLMIIF